MKYKKLYTKVGETKSERRQCNHSEGVKKATPLKMAKNGTKLVAENRDSIDFVLDFDVLMLTLFSIIFFPYQ